MSLLDFLLDLEDKEIKFYLEESFFTPLEIRHKLKVIVDGSNFNPVHVLIIESEDKNNIYVSLSPLPLLSYNKSELNEIKKSLKKLIEQLLKDSRVKEKLNSYTGVIGNDNEELLFKYKPINGEIEVF